MLGDTKQPTRIRWITGYAKEERERKNQHDHKESECHLDSESRPVLLDLGPFVICWLLDFYMVLDPLKISPEKQYVLGLQIQVVNSIMRFLFPSDLLSGICPLIIFIFWYKLPKHSFLTTLIYKILLFLTPWLFWHELTSYELKRIGGPSA